MKEKEDPNMVNFKKFFKDESDKSENISEEVSVDETVVNDTFTNNDKESSEIIHEDNGDISVIKVNNDEEPTVKDKVHIDAVVVEDKVNIEQAKDDVEDIINKTKDDAPNEKVR
jgi:hypothetical protein